MILFLDFDGVLHPDGAILKNGAPCMPCGSDFFVWASGLQNALAMYDQSQLQIVLSTSWAHSLGYRYACEALPADIGCRVIDATWHKDHYLVTGITNSRWWKMPRHKQIELYTEKHSIHQWLAIDNNHDGFGPSKEDCIVRCDSAKGLSCPDTRQSLSGKLRKMMRKSPAQPEMLSGWKLPTF